MTFTKESYASLTLLIGGYHPTKMQTGHLRLVAPFIKVLLGLFLCVGPHHIMKYLCIYIHQLHKEGREDRFCLVAEAGLEMHP